MKAQLVYMTAANMEEARTIGRALVQENLAACINILGPMESIFRWQDRVQEEGEVAFLAKTTEARLPALAERVAALHSYDVPCVVALPAAGGHGPFLEWIAAATTSPGDDA